MQVRSELFIGGRWTAASDCLVDVVSPATEVVIGRVPSTSVDDVDRAVVAARAALDGPWRELELDGRAAVIERAAAFIADRAESLAHTITAEQGTPFAMAERGLAPAVPQIMRAAVTCAQRVPLREVRHDPQGPVLVQQEPVGVVSAMVPFNGPLPIAALKTVPALLAGCPVILKPSPQAPLAVFLLADALEAAGLPAGMFSLLTGGSEVGEAMVAHPNVDMVSFTGSTSVGREIAGACGTALKHATLELGGKSAAVLLDDADLDAALATIAAGVFANAGQYCRALTRVIAPQARAGEVVDRLVSLTERFRAGDPFAATTTMAPLISESHRGRVERFIRAGVEEGARLVTGGRRPPAPDRGWWLEPTVFADATNDMRIARAEIFGPVITVIPARDLDDAVAIADASDYGLSGAVFTEDLAAGLEVCSRIRTGTTGVNLHGARSFAPCGGVKASGIGQEHGPEGFQEFLTPKTILIPDELASALETDGTPSWSPPPTLS